MAAAPGWATALGASAASAVLLLAAPSPSRALDVLRAPSAAGDPTALLVAAVALLAEVLAGWLLLTALLTLLSQVPGGVGTAARAAVRRTAPAALRQLVGTALGVTVLAGTVAAPAAAATGSPGQGTPESAVSLDWPAPATPDLDWPGPPEAPRGTAPAAAPDLDRPAGQGPAPVLGAATSTGAAADAVVVQPGDSLWSVAEDALEQQRGVPPAAAAVAAAWPTWWSANRDVVGDDPDLLLPGTALQPPAAPAARPVDAD